MKVFNKIFLCIFLLLGISLYSQSNSNYKKGVSNILNAQNPDDIGIRSASQIQEDKDDPLEYGYVNDKDILWSTTVWEIIDLDQRVNYPLLYPIDTNVVGKERRPMLWWLRQEIEKFNIPVYDPGFDEGEFLEKVPNEDIENIFQIKINTEKGDQRLEDVVYELEEQITSQVEKYGFNPYEEEISAEQKQVLDSDTTFVKMFPYEIKDYSSYKLLSSRDFSYEQFLGFTSPDGAVRFMQPDGIADLLSPEEVVEYNAALEELLSELFFEENDDFYYKNLELEDLKQWLIKGIWYFDKKYSELIYRPIGLAPVTKPLQKNDDDDFLGGPLDNTYEPPPVNGPDSDGDGIGDQDEIDGFETDPQVADTDADGFNDGDEINKFFTDPLNPNEFPSESDVAAFDNPSPNPEQQTNTAAPAISKLRPIFWVYYPHAREILKKGQAFNNRNTSKYVSFDDIINSRRFGSVIYKEENVYENRKIDNYIKNNSFMRLLESERIKEKIRNFEHDMWSW